MCNIQTFFLIIRLQPDRINWMNSLQCVDCDMVVVWSEYNQTTIMPLNCRCSINDTNPRQTPSAQKYTHLSARMKDIHDPKSFG